MIVRGYLCGSTWCAYKSGVREICGCGLYGRECVKENEKISETISHPTTKKPKWVIARRRHLQRRNPEAKDRGYSGRIWRVLEKYTLALFKRGTEILCERLIPRRCKYHEFGKHNGTGPSLMDETTHRTSSRLFLLWRLSGTLRKRRTTQKRSSSKNSSGEWLMENGFQGKEGQKVPPENDSGNIVQSISDRYIELFGEHHRWEICKRRYQQYLNVSKRTLSEFSLD